MDPADRLAALEARVAVLEGAAPAAVPPAPSEEPGGSGEVGYHGRVRLHGDVTWTIRYDAAATLGLADATAADVLAALGHPVRLTIVRHLLAGPASTAELTEAAALSSTGQLYHHLRTLTSARVVEQDGRTYRVPPTGIVPVLVAILAAADLGGAFA